MEFNDRAGSYERLQKHTARKDTVSFFRAPRIIQNFSETFAENDSFPGTTVTDIVLDPTDWGTAYVLDATDVYMTHNTGTTWTAITGTLTDTRLGTAAIDPGPPARIFVVGREDGDHVVHRTVVEFDDLYGLRRGRICQQKEQQDQQ